jgi:hypothetical protein
MKKIIIILASIIFVGDYCKAQSTLLVKVKDCRGESSFVNLSEFKLFRNGSLVKKVKPTRLESEKTIKGLKYGKYRIEYETIFGKTESANIELTEKKKYSLDLCLDYFDYESDSYQPFIDRLKNGESYSIHVSSEGCFHFSDETMFIKKESDKLVLTFQENNIQLDSNSIRAIRHFEKELNFMKSFSCTTTDTYVLKYNGLKVEIADGSCAWHGAYYLKKKLKLNKK